MKDAEFNYQCISNAERFFSETLSPKKQGQASFEKNDYQDSLLVSFTATQLFITTATQTGENLFSIIKSEECFCHNIAFIVWCH